MSKLFCVLLIALLFVISATNIALLVMESGSKIVPPEDNTNPIAAEVPAGPPFKEEPELDKLKETVSFQQDLIHSLGQTTKRHNDQIKELQEYVENLRRESDAQDRLERQLQEEQALLEQ